jgi:hypothetical protein
LLHPVRSMQRKLHRLRSRNAASREAIAVTPIRRATRCGRRDLRRAAARGAAVLRAARNSRRSPGSGCGPAQHVRE